MNIRQQTQLRNHLLRTSERGLDRKRSGYKILAGCVVACVLIVAYSAIRGAA